MSSTTPSSSSSDFSSDELVNAKLAQKSLALSIHSDLKKMKRHSISGQGDGCQS